MKMKNPPQVLRLEISQQQGSPNIKFNYSSTVYHKMLYIVSMEMKLSNYTICYHEIKPIFSTLLFYTIDINIKLDLFGTLKLALALQFIVMNAYFSVARTLTLVLHVSLK